MSRIIIQNCNVCVLDIPLKYAQKLYQEYGIKHPQAFYLRSRVRGMANWDGQVRFITKSGQFKIGLLPSVYESCKAMGLKDVEIVDLRAPVPTPKAVPHHVSSYRLRPEQIKAVKGVINNRINNHPFYIGVLNLTMNAGKTLIMAALYKTFPKLKTLILIQDADWLNQAKIEFKSYLPKEPITYIQGKIDGEWNRLSIGMVQSLSRNIKFYQRELSKVDMVLVDEADQATSKMYTTVLTHLFNTRVRIGLSGTIYMNNTGKDKLKDMNIESFFGKEVSKFTLKESIERHYSTNVIVKSIDSRYLYYKGWESLYLDYEGIYKETVIEHKISRELTLDRLNFNLKYGRIPALVVCKFVKHAEILYEYLSKELKQYKLACVHVETPTGQRNKIIQDFREGKIDILVSTTLIARGKNFPLLRYLLNVTSMDAKERTIQLLGRLVRTHKSKTRAYLDDIIFPGDYLRRHGYRRRSYYIKQGLKVLVIPRKKSRKKNPSRTRALFD